MRRFKEMSNWGKAVVIMLAIVFVIGLVFLASYIASLYVDMTYPEVLKLVWSFGVVKPAAKVPVEPTAPVETIATAFKAVA